MYYNVCQRCGAALDPGEKCDCEEQENRKRVPPAPRFRKDLRTGQMILEWGSENEKAM